MSARLRASTDEESFYEFQAWSNVLRQRLIAEEKRVRDQGVRERMKQRAEQRLMRRLSEDRAEGEASISRNGELSSVPNGYASESSGHESDSEPSADEGSERNRVRNRPTVRKRKLLRKPNQTPKKAPRPIAPSMLLDPVRAPRRLDSSATCCTLL
ncbi:hypothetical protein PBRA_007142 [Plasmodiophora brassicae]|nr:hypothetical protein PBRA_007142 [Plasmodiophora brassicae]